MTPPIIIRLKQWIERLDQSHDVQDLNGIDIYSGLALEELCLLRAEVASQRDRERKQSHAQQLSEQDE